MSQKQISSELKVINKSNQERSISLHKQTNLTLVNANKSSNVQFVCKIKTVNKAEDKSEFSSVNIPTCSSQIIDRNLSESEINPTESRSLQIKIKFGRPTIGAMSSFPWKSR